MTNFKIEGKEHKSPKGHYVKESPHKMEDEIHRLAKKLDKHIALPWKKHITLKVVLAKKKPRFLICENIKTADLNQQF